VRFPLACYTRLMIKRDLEQAANVLWFAQLPTGGRISGGEQRTFGRLEDAIRFVMTAIPTNVRGLAWITVDGADALTFDEIEAIHHGLQL
jgi:hypothetical protein